MLNPFKQNKSLTLLVSLLLLNLLYPFFEISRAGSALYIILYTSTLLAGVYAISSDVRHIAIGVLLVSPILVCHWSNVILNSPVINLVEWICSAMVMTYVVIVLLQQVLTAPKVGLNEIYGAVCVYVLIGTSFAFFYLLLETLAPGSFSLSHSPVNLNTFFYFSFVALSTAGFGDIVAVAPFARTLVVFEIIIGVSYVAVLIGRLISASQFSTPSNEELVESGQRQKQKMLQELLREPVPLRQRPVGLVMAAVMFNFVTSALMNHLRLPFFLDSWGTSLAVILGGWWPGVATAILYNLLMALTIWGASSWIWMFSSLLIAATTWFFCQHKWINLYRPAYLIAGGIVAGILNGLLVQFIIWIAKLPPYHGTYPVYAFFLKVSSHETFAALAEKMFVEVADKTISILVAAVTVFLLRDLLEYYKKKIKNRVK